jgi:hypothetical protein
MVKFQLDTTVIGAVKVETTGTGRTRWTAGLAETGWRPRGLARCIGAVKVETTGTGRTRWTAGLAETGWRPRGLARCPGDHGIDRARRSSQELVEPEPGGDHGRGITRRWIALSTGLVVGYSGCIILMERCLGSGMTRQSKDSSQKEESATSSESF